MIDKKTNEKLKQLRAELENTLTKLNKLITDNDSIHRSRNMYDVFEYTAEPEMTEEEYNEVVEEALKNIINKGFKIPFGKYKGVDFKEIPIRYAEWLYTEMFGNSDPNDFSSEKYKVDKLKLALRQRMAQEAINKGQL